MGISEVSDTIAHAHRPLHNARTLVDRSDLDEARTRLLDTAMLCQLRRPPRAGR
jgi:hypothetical protein